MLNIYNMLSKHLRVTACVEYVSGLQLCYADVSILHQKHDAVSSSFEWAPVVSNR